MINKDLFFKQLSEYNDRDNMILMSREINPTPNIVNVHYWRVFMDQRINSNITQNVGDDLSPIIVNWMLKQRGIDPLKKVKKTKHLYCIGSIIQYGYVDATIWGSGFAYNPFFEIGLFHRKGLRDLDVRCVRGPLSRNTLLELGHECPEVYGDPAVLAPLMYNPDVEKKKDYIIIPQIEREYEFEGIGEDENIVSMNNDYTFVVDQIKSANKVISSSMHGLILAESYGVPAIYYQNREDTMNYKFLDWYYSTGRKEFFSTKNLKEAITHEGNPTIDVTKLQRNLLESFPYDLWD